MKTLDLSQIEALYDFTKQHYVEHYDLQTELVDHLANDIEAIWEKQPSLSFEYARDKSFKKFGVFGFMDVVDQRQKAMSKRYRKYLWEEIKSWFGVPKIILTCIGFCILYIGFSSQYFNYFFLTIYSLLAIWVFYKGIILRRNYKHRKKQTNKKWMLEEIIFVQAGGATAVFFSQIPTFYDIADDYFLSNYFIMGFSIFTALSILLCYISFQLLPSKADTLLKDTYPEFEIA